MNVTDLESRQRKDTVHFHARRDDAPAAEQVRGVSRTTWIGVFVNVFLAVAKGAAGLSAGSAALLADAVHTLSDLATDMAILVCVRIWSAPADVDHPHGHRKIETLVTLGIGVLVALVGLGMGYEAVRTLAAAITSTGDADAAAGNAAGIASLAALAVAALSIVGKELLYRFTAAQGVKLGSSALVANAWHHRSDAISSIPPLLAIGGGALGARLGYNMWFLDPVGTVIVCVMLLQAAWEVVSPTLGTLVDAGADRRICSAIRKTVLSTRGVIDAHKIRTRVIGSNAVAVDLHVIVDENLSVAMGHDIATAVRDRMIAIRDDSKVRVVDVMVHVEPGDPCTRREAGCSENTRADWMYRESP